MNEQRYVIQPTDSNRDWRVARMANDGLRKAAKASQKDGTPHEVIIREWQPPRTDPQRNTMWMWHTQVASELTVRTGKRWTKEDVHEVVFLPRWMPQKELVDPETGEVLHRPVRTSDKAPDGDQSMKQIITDAMTEYLSWTIDMRIEVTVPPEGW